LPLQVRADIAASFQRVALEHLEDRVCRAAGWALEEWPGIEHLVVAGGVAANQLLRSKLQVRYIKIIWLLIGFKVVYEPCMILCTKPQYTLRLWALEEWPSIRHPFVAGRMAANQLLHTKLLQTD
jgi:hypothetical protein